MSKLILRDHYYHDNKVKDITRKKKKMQANIVAEDRCRNSQQNTSKPVHEKHHTS